MSDDIKVQEGDVVLTVEGWLTIDAADVANGWTVERLLQIGGYIRFARPCNAADAYKCLESGQRMECIEIPNAVFVGSNPREHNRLVHALVGPYQVITISDNVFRDLFANPIFRFIPAVP